MKTNQLKLPDPGNMQMYYRAGFRPIGTLKVVGKHELTNWRLAKVKRNGQSKV